MILSLPDNQPHRADIAKMLVQRKARRRGIARRLMVALDDAARQEGRTVLVLDPVSPAALPSGCMNANAGSAWESCRSTR